MPILKRKREEYESDVGLDRFGYRELKIGKKAVTKKNGKYYVKYYSNNGLLEDIIKEHKIESMSILCNFTDKNL